MAQLEYHSIRLIVPLKLVGAGGADAPSSRASAASATGTDPDWTALALRERKLTPDFNPAFERYLDEFTNMWRASERMCAEVSGGHRHGLLLELGERARVRLGVEPRAWLSAKCTQIDLHRLSEQFCFVALYFELGGRFLENGCHGALWRLPDSTTIKVAAPAAPESGDLLEWVHGASALQRSGGRRPWLQLSLPDARGEPFQTRAAPNLVDTVCRWVRPLFADKTIDTDVANRMFSFCAFQAAAALPRTELATLTYRLAKHYTDDYAITASAVEAASSVQFENVVLASSLEGLALGTAGTAVQMLAEVPRNKADSVYLPLYLCALNEYLHIEDVLGRRHTTEDLDLELSHFNRQLRFPLVSQIAHQNEFLRQLRTTIGTRGLIRDLEADAVHDRDARLLRVREERAKTEQAAVELRRRVEKRWRIGGVIVVFFATVVAAGGVGDSWVDLRYHSQLESLKVDLLGSAMQNASFVASPATSQDLTEENRRYAEVLENRERSGWWAFGLALLAGLVAAVATWVTGKHAEL